MGANQIAPEATLDLIALPSENIPIICESRAEVDQLKLPSHPADWFARLPCGLVVACCERRRAWAVACDGVWCDLGCGLTHTYDEISWVPIAL